MVRRKDKNPHREDSTHKNDAVTYKTRSNKFKKVEREVTELRYSIKLVISVASFSCMAGEVLMEIAQIDMKVRTKALQALHQPSEIFDSVFRV